MDRNHFSRISQGGTPLQPSLNSINASSNLAPNRGIIVEVKSDPNILKYSQLRTQETLWYSFVGVSAIVAKS
jgi:hypothetical protein